MDTPTVRLDGHTVEIEYEGVKHRLPIDLSDPDVGWTWAVPATQGRIESVNGEDVLVYPWPLPSN